MTHESDAGAYDQRLSTRLLELAGEAREASLTLGELIEKLEGRVYTLLLVLLSLPFCQPIALPGLSTPFGIVITLFGFRFALRQKPWLPRKFLTVQLPSRFLPTVLEGSAKLLGLLERILRPRVTEIFEFRLVRLLAGLMISTCGLLLLLPLPIPFSNMLPALTVVLLAASFSERDSVILAAGGVIFLLTLAFFSLIFLGSVETIEWIQSHFRGFFETGETSDPLGPGQ